MNPAVREEIREITSTLPDLSGERILVTGGAGFLGSWLCNILSSIGASVVCVDNFSTGVKNFLDSSVRCVVGDVENLRLGGRYDCVFHMASRASPDLYQIHPIETLTSNSLGTQRALKIASQSHAVFVFSSTSEVYGDAQVVPTPEDYWGHVNPTGLRSCYDEGKRFGEAMCMAYSRQERTKVRIARIFNSYGPAMRHDGAYGRVISRLVSQALRGENMTIYGDGNQTRSFCYVTDTIQGLLKLATVPDIDGEAFNIGNTVELRIREVVETIIRNTKSKSQISYLPAKPDDPRRRCPDISKASRVLKWAPSVSFDAGLPKTIRWLKSVLRTGKLVDPSSRQAW